MAITTNIENKDLREHPKATREFWKEFLGIERGEQLKSEPWYLCVHKNEEDRLIFYSMKTEAQYKGKLNLSDNPNCKNTRRNPLNNKNLKEWIDGKLDTSEKATATI